MVDEPVTVVVSAEGLGARAEGPRDRRRPRCAFKAGDSAVRHLRMPHRRHAAGLRHGQGQRRVYSVPVAPLPGGRGDGQPITTLIDLETGTQLGALLRRRRRRRGCCWPTAAATASSRRSSDMARAQPRRQGLPDAGRRPPAAAAGGGGGRRTRRCACWPQTGGCWSSRSTSSSCSPAAASGLTLMDVDRGRPAGVGGELRHAAARARQRPRRQGQGRDAARAAALAAHVGKRARKGRKIDGFVKPQRSGARRVMLPVTPAAGTRCGG